MPSYIGSTGTRESVMAYNDQSKGYSLGRHHHLCLDGLADDKLSFS